MVDIINKKIVDITKKNMHFLYGRKSIPIFSIDIIES